MYVSVYTIVKLKALFYFWKIILTPGVFKYSDFCRFAQKSVNFVNKIFSIDNSNLDLLKRLNI